MDRRAARKVLRRLYFAALAGVEPEAAVARALARARMRAAVARARRVGIFAAGKAAAGMARAALRELPGVSSLPHVPALVVLPRGYAARGLGGAEILRAAHPRPDSSSVRAARRSLRFFASFAEGDLVLCLMSGGASSLLTLPRAGVSLSEKRRRVDALVRAGAPIGEVNRLRTALSTVKGGRLGAATRARVITLVLSDVPGDRASLVGSGPTIRNRRGDLVRVVGSNGRGLDAAAEEARRLGLQAVRSRRRLAGHASAAGRRAARHAKALSPGAVWLAGGETVVALGAARSRGGRSLETVLSAALALEGEADLAWLAAGSDGRDGSSLSAGAFADTATLTRARRLGLDPRAALDRHATHAFFARLSDLLMTGPTGTNVGDWIFLLRGTRRRRPRR